MKYTTGSMLAFMSLSVGMGMASIDKKEFSTLKKESPKNFAYEYNTVSSLVEINPQLKNEFTDIYTNVQGSTSLDDDIMKELQLISKMSKKTVRSKTRSKTRVYSKKNKTRSKRMTISNIKKVLPWYVKGNKLVIKECRIPARVFSKMNIHEIHEMTFEGCHKRIYKDHLGNKTIGIGHLITKKDRRNGLKRLTTNGAIKLFKKDRKKHARRLYRAFPWIKNQPYKVQEFLKSFAFNIGVGKPSYTKKGKYYKATGMYQFKRMLADIKKGHYKSAAYGLSRSRYCRQVQKSRSKYYLKLLRSS